MQSSLASCILQQLLSYEHSQHHDRGIRGEHDCGQRYDDGDRYSCADFDRVWVYSAAPNTESGDACCCFRRAVDHDAGAVIELYVMRLTRRQRGSVFFDFATGGS